MSEDDVDDLLEQESLGEKLDGIHSVLEEIHHHQSSPMRFRSGLGQ